MGEMVSLRKYISHLLLQCAIYSFVTGFVSNMCNEREYLHQQTGQCLPCTVCDDVGLLTWLPCTAHSNTVCGPKWTVPPSRGSESPEQTESDRNSNSDSAKDLGEDMSMRTVEHVFIGVLIGLVLATAIVMILSCLLYRRRPRLSVYSLAFKDELKSLEDIGELLRTFFLNLLTC